MTHRPIQRTVLAALALGLLLGLTACQKTSPPRRVPPGETTAGELNDPRQLPVSLVEFQEAAANDILQSLPDLPEISETPGPVTILVGDINNKTSLVPTTDYEYITSGVRTRLIRAGATRGKLEFVERRARVERLADRERVATGPAPNVTGPRGGEYYVPDYDASTTYALNMDVNRIGRGVPGQGETNQYRMEIQLVSFASNRIVYSYQDEMKQVSR